MGIKKISFLICFVTTIAVFSQNNKKNLGSLSGIILSAKSNKSLAYATIICKDKKHTIINGSITNKKGEFKIAKKDDGGLMKPSVIFIIKILNTITMK